LGIRIDNRQVRRGPFPEQPPLHLEQAGRGQAHHPDGPGRIQDPLLHQGQREGKRRLQPDDPEGGLFELHILFQRAVRGVVSGYDVYDPLPHPLLHGLHVLRPPERRVHLGLGAVPLHRRVIQGEVVGRGLGRYSQPVLPGPPDEGDRAFGAHVGYVNRAPGEARQGDLPVDHYLLRGGRNARQADARGHRALVHGPSGGQGPVLGVGNHGEPAVMRVLQRAPHDLAVCNGKTVVGNTHRARGPQVAELG
jgi:hypothetical protein